MTLDDLHRYLSCNHVVCDGPPTAFFRIGGMKCEYKCFAFAGERATDSELITALYDILMSRLGKTQAFYIFWRKRPAIEEHERKIFETSIPPIKAEDVLNGTAIPEGWVQDFDTGVYRKLLRVEIIRTIHCRVWWEGLEEGNRNEGDEFPPLPRPAP